MQEIADHLGVSRQRIDQILEPLKSAARAAVQDALASCVLSRPDTCPKCGATGTIEAHHHDYSKPLDVEWLCLKCHRREHSGEPNLNRGISFDEDLLRRIDAFASSEDRTFSNAVRLLIKRGLDASQGKQEAAA